MKKLATEKVTWSPGLIAAFLLEVRRGDPAKDEFRPLIAHTTGRPNLTPKQMAELGYLVEEHICSQWKGLKEFVRGLRSSEMEYSDQVRAIGKKMGVMGGTGLVLSGVEIHQMNPKVVSESLKSCSK